MNEFMNYLEAKLNHARKLSPLTIGSHLQTLRMLEAWYLATYNEVLNLNLLTNYDLLAFRSWSLDKQRVAASTWNVRRAGLAALADMLGDQDLMQGVAAVDPKEAEIRWLSDEDYGRFIRRLERRSKESVTALEAERSSRDRAAVSLMLFAGLRVEEVADLEVNDIEINERSGRVLVRHGKGDKRAEVPLGLPARRAVAAWLEESGITSGSLFGVSKRTLQRTVTQIGAEARISGLSAHDLRHTYVKRTLDGKNSKDGAPVSLNIVKKLARHSRIETTLRYVEPSWNEMAAAVEVM